MVNCNPETVSTDYDTSDRLYFEPLDAEAVLAVLRARAAASASCIQFGGQTPLKLAARDRGGRLPDPRHAVRRGRPRRGPRALRPARRRARHPLPGWGMADDADEAVRGRRADRLSGARAAVVRARRPRDARLLHERGGARGDGAVDGRGARRPLPRERGRDRRRRALRRHRHLHRRGDAARRGGRRPLGRLGVRAAGAVARPGDGPRSATSCGGSARALGVVGLLNVQLAVAGRRPLRARGEPARVAHGAVRLEGDRHQSRRRGVPPRGGRAHRRARAAAGAAAGAGERQGRRAPVRALPRRRSGARAGDALDRRGDGERARLPDRVREGGARGRPSAAARGRGVPLGPRRRQAGDRCRSPRRSPGSASSSSRPAARRRRCAARVIDGASEIDKGEAGRRADPQAALSISSSTRRRAATRARDGYAIREAALASRIPCITTLAGAATAVHAIAGARAEQPLSLQERIELEAVGACA